MKALLLIATLLGASFSYAAKTYQVTGPVLEVSDTKIVIEKGHDKWEIDRTADTKVMGDLKVGEKVTIEYTMAAKSVEPKESKGMKKKK